MSGPRQSTRDHAVCCSDCGPGSRVRTWNDSALCDRHEAEQARREAVQALVDGGYSYPLAVQIVARMSVPA